MIHPILTIGDGTKVYVDLIHSEASRSIARQPQLVGLVREALKGKRLAGLELRIEHNMKRVVGYDFVVDATDENEVFYAQLLRDTTYTRFIKKGKPLATQYIAIELKRGTSGRAYELQAVRIGRLTPPRPGTPTETPQSRQYWASHAFVHEDQVFQLRTVTKLCPY